MSAYILETKDLVKTFQSGSHSLTVLERVSIQVESGSTCAVVGPSGSGKTTLLGLCAGLDDPTSGQILINNKDITQFSEEERARWRTKSVGFVFQTFRLIPTLTALENVMVPAELDQNPNARFLAEDLLSHVGLSDRMDHYPSQLSGGEQQRVGLARAFINHPEILFADEPTGNLDAENSNNVIHLLFELNEKWNTSLILVTHDAELAKKTKKVIHLDKGRQV